MLITADDADSGKELVELDKTVSVLRLLTIMEEEDTVIKLEGPTDADVTTAVLLMVVVLSSIVDSKVIELGATYMDDDNTVVTPLIDMESGVLDWVELRVSEG